MKYFFLALSVMLLWSSCAKNPTINYSRESMLRSGKWHISSGTLSVRKPNGVDTVLDYTHWIPYCHRDDYVIFDSLNIGYVYPGTILCNPSDDSVEFQWSMNAGQTTLSLYNGFSNTFGVVESVVNPYYTDTFSKSPLVLDTIVGAVAAAATGTSIVIDSIWNLHFDSSSIAQLNIYNATISSFSSDAFTINFAAISTYPDSTDHHTGPPTDASPIIRADTFHYSVTYSH